VVHTEAADMNDGVRYLVGTEGSHKSPTPFPEDIVQKLKRWECARGVPRQAGWTRR